MTAEHFFIVGAQRSGTTHLYQLCAEHPEIEMAQPVKPEPKFFMNDALFELGMDYYRKHYFAGKESAHVLGEKSTSYIEVETVARRISQWFPSAKIVFIFRNPIHRAVSNYWFSVKNGFEKEPPDVAFMKEEERWQNFDAERVSVSPYAYLRRGRYIEYVEMYEKYFSPEQIHIVIHERLIQSDQSLRGLYSFLGVDPAFQPAALHTIVNANDEKPKKPLEPGLTAYLQSYFADSVARLEARLGYSISEWGFPRN